MTAPKKRRAGSAERRARVLDATLRLLAREGPRGVTHRAVAAEAGTSLRATTYYFASRQQLLTEALQHYADRAIERFDALRVPLSGDVDFVELAAAMLAQTVLSDLEEDRAGLVAEYELVLEIGRNQTLESTYRAWQDRLLALLAAYAEQFGSPDPQADARLVLATLRGLEIEALANPSAPPTHEQLAATFRRLLGALERLARDPA